MTEIMELEPDEQPTSGVWVETCELIESLTEEEVAEGNQLGLVINPDDDQDDGLTPPTMRTLVAPERERTLEKARALRSVMLDFGVPEVSIELQPGRPNDYGEWDALFVVADMSHHTVSRYRPDSLTPVLSLCKRGRSDLPGPLCNGYGGWDLTYRIITFGYANHPGEGGPLTVPALTAGKFTIPKDSARRYAWGTEWEGGLAEADWDRVLANPRTGHKMTMREFMGRSNAAIEKYMQIHEEAHLEHSTWTSRKIDRLGYTAAKGIAEKKKYSSEEEDMGQYDKVFERIENRQKRILQILGKEGAIRTKLNTVLTRLNELETQVSDDATREQVRRVRGDLAEVQAALESHDSGA